MLTELARQVALALHNVQLDAALQASLDELQVRNDELQQSRARIVAAGDAERRKLERNLHDGAQQHLVALAVKLRLTRDAVEDDPDDAIAMIDEIKGNLQDAIQELRALAHGIFPPLLMSGGLAEALPAAATRAALPTTIDIAGIGRYSADMEAAVYFCVLEAMQNAGKHAGEGADGACHGGRGRRGADVLDRRRRRRLRGRRARRRRARLRQHGRPPRRLRRDARRHVGPRQRDDRQRDLATPSLIHPSAGRPAVRTPDTRTASNTRMGREPGGVAAGLPEAAYHAGTARPC